jgi:hypothetical protein
MPPQNPTSLPRRRGTDRPETEMSTTLIPTPRTDETGNPPAVPYLHQALASVAPLAGALAPRRPLWTPDELARLTELLVRTAPGTLRRIARHDPAQRWYARLALTEQVEVWLIGWSPGQGTRAHNHGGAAGAFTVLAGGLTETYRDGAGPVHRTLIDARGGSAFGPDRLHLVENPGRVDATSVHAYSPPLLPLGERDSLGEAGTIQA